jgi:ribosome-associated protein
VSSAERSQLQNREDVTARFVRIVAKALHVAKPRKKTRLPRAAKEKRLREKKQRGEIKKKRGRVEDLDV